MLDPLQFQAGQQLCAVRLAITADEADTYRAAINEKPRSMERKDAQALPPALLAARGLRAVIEHVTLPPGTIHTGQDCDFLAAVLPGEALLLEAYVVRSAVRKGQCFLTLDTLLSRIGEPVYRGRTSLIVLVPPIEP